ncbi:PREDICTED: acyl-CoA-binding domain-containing protein 6 [Corvus brachyrhynchos]|uniref:acyl-CoA-binding domain-containing protein 6 n=1 Tax=Corvus brachyrhynchos TaxID=85066 RepID=UPI00081635FD|nr:PREDICTED: acyl-CoA-binding domain-containing protein 6 [Corvus brachyrhynchos]
MRLGGTRACAGSTFILIHHPVPRGDTATPKPRPPARSPPSTEVAGGSPAGSGLPFAAAGGGGRKEMELDSSELEKGLEHRSLVKLGTCNTPKPSFFDFEGKQKWEAWKALGDTSPHQAMQEYVAAVKKLDPSWNPQTTEKRGKESKTVFGGPVISSLYQEETIREEDKNIFDYCRENNIDYVTKAIQSKKVDVNVTDEEGRALLHWACDRGHKELVSVLLQNAADVNIQDGEGQTALHYAATCEFLDIVELLLQAGADPGLRDQEGCLPAEVTDSKAITWALQQHGTGEP